MAARASWGSYWVVFAAPMAVEGRWGAYWVVAALLTAWDGAGLVGVVGGPREAGCTQACSKAAPECDSDMHVCALWEALVQGCALWSSVVG
jgi:hypothetical protein